MALRVCKDIFGMCKRRVDANIRRRTAIGQFEKKIGRLSDDSTTGLLQSVSDISSASCPNQYLQTNKLDEITMGGILNHIQMPDTPTARDVSGFGHLSNDFFLPFVQLRFDGRCHHEPGFRDADAIHILARSGE